MLPSEAPTLGDNLTGSFSREREDELDWQENQRRSADDVRRVDGLVLAGSSLVTFLWLTAGLGAVGGVIAVGSWLFSSFLAR